VLVACADNKRARAERGLCGRHARICLAAECEAGCSQNESGCGRTTIQAAQPSDQPCVLIETNAHLYAAKHQLPVSVAREHTPGTVASAACRCQRLGQSGSNSRRHRPRCRCCHHTGPRQQQHRSCCVPPQWHTCWMHPSSMRRIAPASHHLNRDSAAQACTSIAQASNSSTERPPTRISSLHKAAIAAACARCPGRNGRQIPPPRAATPRPQ
jgi:hypothetical protein